MIHHDNAVGDWRMIDREDVTGSERVVWREGGHIRGRNNPFSSDQCQVSNDEHQLATPFGPRGIEIYDIWVWSFGLTIHRWTCT